MLLNDFLQFNDFLISYIKVISPKIKIEPNKCITLKTDMLCINCERHNGSDKISPIAKHNILEDNTDVNNFMTARV